MKKWSIYGKVVGSKFIGVFEANTREEALKKAERQSYASFCYQCSSECESPEVCDLQAEEEN